LVMPQRKMGRIATALVSVAILQFAWLSQGSAQIRKVDDVSLENLIAESQAAVESLAALGHPIAEADRRLLEAAWSLTGDEAKGKIQDVVDRYCWVEIRIDDEAWLKAEAASPNPGDRILEQGKWTPFLVKIYNKSDAQSAIEVRSAQELLPPEVPAVEQGDFSASLVPHSWYRWLALKFYQRNRETKPFPGVNIKYRVVGILSRDSGMRSADLEFYFGGGAVSQGHYVKKQLLFEVKQHEPRSSEKPRSEAY